MILGCEIRSLHEQVEAGLEMSTFARVMQGLFVVLLMREIICSKTSPGYFTTY